jgi:proteasome lid subunit RPN8/RPN11
LDFKKNITYKFEDLNISEYPLNYETIGAISENERFSIFIHHNVIEEIDSFLISDVYNECGGVLLGKIFKTESNKLFVIVDNFIIAKSTKSSISRLTFTHDTWNGINNELEVYHKDNIILGWFHSHPGHGVFLSGYDIFIQENFFNDEFMIAYVYDPVNNERAFFQWLDGQIVKSNGYNIIKKNPIPALDLSEPSGKTTDEDTSQKKTVVNKYLVILFSLLIINMIILIMLIVDNNKMKTQILDSKIENSQINNIKTSIDKLEFKVNDLILRQLNKEDSVELSNKFKK